MDREVFFKRFQAAVLAARDFARTTIEEPLADEVRCRLYLNSSYDGNPLHEDETVFPEDSLPERGFDLVSIPVEEAAAVLWRGGKVPEWINVAVVTRTRQTTVVQVDSCGRFTATEDLLYHAWEGRPPFHVLGPALPLNYVQGEPFSIYYRSSCCTAEEFQAVGEHRARPWSLELAGPAFDDNALAAVGPFPALEILELMESPLHGSGLSGCSQMPRLRIIRITRHPRGKVSLNDLPHLPTLEELTMSGLNEPPDLAVLASATPALTELSLAFTSTERAVAVPRIEALTTVKLSAEHLRHGIRFPEENNVREITIHGEHSDGEILGILQQLPSLTSVDLSGTGVTDETIRFLSHNNHLSYVSLDDTKVTDAGLDSLRAKYPQTRIRPYPAAR
jgi:hypothetical protein